MGLAQWLVLAVALQRLAETAHGARNARRLLAAGGREAGRRHYPLLVLLHAAWLVSIFVLVPAETRVNVPLIALYALLQLVRLWVIASLGRHWTTRVITVPGAAPVRRGPYRVLRHPNYLVVIGEIAVLPLAFGAWEIALAFSLANLALLGHRIRVENAALEPARARASRSDP